MIPIVKLFGFDLTDTSAVLLFIFALGMIFGSSMGIYYCITIYNATSQIPAWYLVFSLGFLFLGFYILYKTIQQRNK